MIGTEPSIGLLIAQAKVCINGNTTAEQTLWFKKSTCKAIIDKSRKIEATFCLTIRRKRLRLLVGVITRHWIFGSYQMEETRLMSISIKAPLPHV